MGKSQYIDARDGLPARVSGRWAREKLHYVRRYNEIVASGMKRKWAARGYLDLMAGSGRCTLANGQEFDGSPLVALSTTPPFDEALFVEADPELCAALHTRVAAAQGSPMPTILPGECNGQDTREEILKNLSTDGLTVAFADMLGVGVAFDTVTCLSNARRLDWLITFQVNDLQRNATRALESGDGSRLDAFFGSPDWRVSFGRVSRKTSQAGRSPTR